VGLCLALPTEVVAHVLSALVPHSWNVRMLLLKQMRSFQDDMESLTQLLFLHPHPAPLRDVHSCHAQRSSEPHERTLDNDHGSNEHVSSMTVAVLAMFIHVASTCSKMAQRQLIAALSSLPETGHDRTNVILVVSSVATAPATSTAAPPSLPGYIMTDGNRLSSWEPCDVMIVSFDVCERVKRQQDLERSIYISEYIDR
jgi:hypothetical protein